MNAIESSQSNGSRLGSLRAVDKVRFAGFTLVVLALFAVNLTLTPPGVLSAAFVGWFEELGVHQVHDMTVAAMIWIALLIPLALLLYRPSGRVNTVLAPLVLLVPVTVMAYVVESTLVEGFLVGSVLALLALLLHPAGRSLMQFDRTDAVDRRIAGLYVIGAVPLLGYAGLELAKQFGPVDGHVLFVHFGVMAIAAIYVALMGGLAVVRQRDWRFAVWSAGVVAAFVGAASVVYPASESSLGLLGGALVLLWAVALVASIEYTRGSLEESKDKPIDEPAARSV